MTERRVYLFRGQWVTITEAATLSGMSPRQMLRRVRGDVIEETPPPRGGPKPKRYEFRGQRLTVKEIAALAGVSQVTAYHRRSGDRILELDEIEPLTPERGDDERLLTFRGRTRNIAEWGRITGFGRWCIYQRLDKLGWSVARALTTPVAHPRRLVIARMVTAFRRARNAHAVARMIAAFATSTGGLSRTFPDTLGTGGGSFAQEIR